MQARRCDLRLLAILSEWGPAKVLALNALADAVDATAHLLSDAHKSHETVM
jgi:hypothetical protein